MINKIAFKIAIVFAVFVIKIDAIEPDNVSLFIDTVIVTKINHSKDLWQFSIALKLCNWTSDTVKNFSVFQYYGQRSTVADSSELRQKIKFAREHGVDSSTAYGRGNIRIILLSNNRDTIRGADFSLINKPFLPINNIKQSLLPDSCFYGKVFTTYVFHKKVAGFHVIVEYNSQFQLCRDIPIWKRKLLSNPSKVKFP